MMRPAEAMVSSGLPPVTVVYKIKADEFAGKEHNM